MKIEGTHIMITGGAGGIGHFLAKGLSARGAQVIAVDRDAGTLEKVRKEMSGIQTIACDVTDYSQVSDMANRVERIDVLINNAGLIYSEPLVNILDRDDPRHKVETWHDTIHANLDSVFYVTSCIAAKMVAQKVKGLIINVSSVSARGNAGQSAYSAAKAGVVALAVTWSKELGMFGIRSAAIAPGFFDTPSTRAALSEANLKKWEKSVPLGRMGQLEEILHGVEFMIGNDYYNGKVLELDGGLRL